MVVVTQKVVSKAEGRMVEIDPSDGNARRELAESEAVRVLRRRGDLVVTETRHGFVCANSGVDLSNVADGWAVLLPLDPDRSARRLRDGLHASTGVEVAVVISDTFGRAWRRGVTDVAIGCAGIRGVIDLRGTTDALGRELVATEIVRHGLRADRPLVIVDSRDGKGTGHPGRGGQGRRSRLARQGRGRRGSGQALRRGSVPVTSENRAGAEIVPASALASATR